MCVDGRIDSSKQDEFGGPKIQGGALGVAAMLARMENASSITAQHVEEACNRIKKAGYNSGVHDVSDRDLHCGRMVVSEQVGDLPWGITFDDSAKIITDHSGAHTHLDGQHGESIVNVNFVEGTTRIPDPDNQKFQLDAWFAQQIGLDLDLVLGDAVKTVELLDGPKIARIFE
jgi:hypothetical protein